MFRQSTPVAAAVTIAILAATSARGQWSEKKTLTVDGAHKAIGAIVAEAGRRGTTSAIAVIDDVGNLMASSESTERLRPRD
jgi:hypothetical protein